MSADILFAAQVFGMGFIISLFMAVMIRVILKVIRLLIKN